MRINQDYSGDDGLAEATPGFRLICYVQNWNRDYPLRNALLEAN